jgi:cell division protein FtsB
MSWRTMALLSLGVLIGLTSVTVFAQTAPGQGNAAATNTPSSTPQSVSAPASLGTTTTAANAQPSATSPPPKVTKVVDGHLELDDIIQIEVDHLTEWMNVAGNDPRKLVPYINGRAVRGNYPEEIHSSRNRLQFHLEITRANKDVWTDLLGAPTGATNPVAFSVGLEDKAPFDSVFDQGNKIPLTVISPVYGVVALLVVVFTLVVFVWLARTTNIIRESGPRPGGGKLRPYNLGRTQMAFWFFLVYMSYLVIWLITNALDTITASLLGLMGISAGTALSEAMIDSSKDSAQAAKLEELSTEQLTLEQSINTLQSQIDNLNAMSAPAPGDLVNRDSLSRQVQDNRTRLAQVSDQIQTLSRPASAGASGGFLRDILSDSSGYSFHRFQIFAWTIVLGIIFVSAVYNSLSMPEFSATLLGLMGLSSGTYIGFKFPEKK